jgi:hypothetical protein
MCEIRLIRPSDERPMAGSKRAAADSARSGPTQAEAGRSGLGSNRAEADSADGRFAADSRLDGRAGTE